MNLFRRKKRASAVQAKRRLLFVCSLDRWECAKDYDTRVRNGGYFTFLTMGWCL